MEPAEILKGLIESRDPGMTACKKFLADRGLSLTDNPQHVLERCQTEAERGASEAQYVLATFLWTGVLGITEREAAVKWCRLSADAEYLPALTMLSGFYQAGAPGILKDLPRAIQLLERAANLNYAPALAYLATAYLHGLGVPEDQVRGLALLREAAGGGDVLAQSQLGAHLIESADPAAVISGMQWLQAAAKQGLPSAHRILAELFETGAPGVPADPDLAQRHREAALALEIE